MIIRHIRDSDYDLIISLVDSWWGGRHMASMLPRLFFQYFQDTCFVAEEKDFMLGFLIGFISQNCKEKAYIHFIGVHPDYRLKGVAKSLYKSFFNEISKHGCKTVHCVTSPINKTSILFHKSMGFCIEKGDVIVDGIYIKKNYDGANEDRVLFTFSLVV